MGASWGTLRASWGGPGGFLEASRSLLGPLGCLQGLLAGLFGSHRAFLARLMDDLLEASWAVLEASWVPLGPSWAFLGACWARLETSWTLSGRLRGHLGRSWANLEAIRAVLKATLVVLEAIWATRGDFSATFRVAGGLGRNPRGSASGKGTNTNP